MLTFGLTNEQAQFLCSPTTAVSNEDMRGNIVSWQQVGHHDAVRLTPTHGGVLPRRHLTHWLSLSPIQPCLPC